MNQNPSLQELYHFGIPGMKWGRRKGGISKKTVQTVQRGMSYVKKKRSAKRAAFIKQYNIDPNYASKHLDADVALYGARGVRAINKRIQKGMSIEKARKREFKKQLAIGLGLAGAEVYGAHKIRKAINNRVSYGKPAPRSRQIPYVTGKIIDI